MQEECERHGQRKCDCNSAGGKSRSPKDRSEKSRSAKAKKDVLCGWKKDSFLKDYDRFRRIVERSRFACKKCGRVAAEESWLCKPIRLAQ